MGKHGHLSAPLSRVVVLALMAVLLAVTVSPAQASGRVHVTRATAPIPLTPSRGPRVTSRFFAVHAPALGETFPQAPVGAVNLMTDSVYWPRLETAPGVFDFTHLDALVERAEANHAQPLLVLGLTPSFHSTDPTAPRLQATLPDPDAWREYVTQVVTRYGDRVDYQVWPEPNVSLNWVGTPREMAQLVAVASTIIHGAAPRAVVVAPAMVLRLRYQRRFMRDFFAIKIGGVAVGDMVDAVGIDPYPLVDGTPEDSLTLVLRARHLLDKAGVAAPLWSVEINYGVPFGGIGVAIHGSAARQASYVARTDLLSAGAGVRRVYWLGWARYPRLDVELVEDDLVTPSSAGRAFSLTRGWLVGQHARGCTFASHRAVYSCTFAKDGRRSTAFWTLSGHTRVRAPSGAHRVQRATGRRLSTSPGHWVRVGIVPVWVTH